MNWNLEWRQEQLYLSRASVFRPDQEPNPVTGLWPDNVTIRRVAAEVPCLYDYTQNDDDPETGLGRVKRRSALTEDGIHFPIVADVQSGDWVRDETPGSQNRGTVHRVMGAGKKLDNLGGRTPNARIVQAMEDEHAQALLTAAGFPFP